MFVRIIFKSGHVERLWLKNIKVETNTTTGAITRMQWEYSWFGRKRLLDVQVGEIAAITYRK